jgi:hypothetical protein
MQHDFKFLTNAACNNLRQGCSMCHPRTVHAGILFFLFVWNDRIFQQLWQARSANKTRYYPHYSKLKDYAPSAIILNKIKKTFNWMTLLMTPIDTLCIGSNILRLERHWKEWKRVRRWALMVGDIVIVWLTKLTSREVYWYKFTRISEIFKAVPITEECNTMKIREWVIKHRLRGMKRVSMNQFDFFLERAEELHIIILRIKGGSKVDQYKRQWANILWIYWRPIHYEPIWCTVIKTSLKRRLSDKTWLGAGTYERSSKVT